MTSSARRRPGWRSATPWCGSGSAPRATTRSPRIPGQAESFDSDPGKAPKAIAHPAGHAFTHLFTKTGRFTYRCRVHPAMRGEVTVIALPPRDVKRPA